MLSEGEAAVAGVDAGSATLGVAVVAGVPGQGRVRLLGMQFVGTKKADKKARRLIRVCTDDVRRLFEIIGPVSKMLDQHKPAALAVEWYALNPGQRGSVGGWKAAVTVGACLALGKLKGLMVLEQIPGDVKRLVGSKAASKQDVEDWLVENLDGFAAAIAKVPKTKREHVADACAHAMVGLQELHERRQAWA